MFNAVVARLVGVLGDPAAGPDARGWAAAALAAGEFDAADADFLALVGLPTMLLRVGSAFLAPRTTRNPLRASRLDPEALVDAPGCLNCKPLCLVRQASPRLFPGLTAFLLRFLCGITLAVGDKRLRLLIIGLPPSATDPYTWSRLLPFPDPFSAACLPVLSLSLPSWLFFRALPSPRPPLSFSHSAFPCHAFSGILSNHHRAVRGFSRSVALLGGSRRRRNRRDCCCLVRHGRVP
jgi:hypothetical protein